jgi:hypothetical protein
MESLSSKALKLAVVVGLSVVTIPGVVGAQSDTPDQASADEAPTSDSSAQDSSDADDAQSADKTSADKTSADEKSADKESSDKQSAESKTKTSEGDKPAKKGPGGRDMREDYPGTDEAMQSQMETDRIEGLEFEGEGAPSEAYDLKLQELETKIDDLKEKVFQSKSRVVLLKETVLGGNLSGSRAVIVHKNKLGPRFKLKRAMYSLDGSRVFNESREGGGLKKSNQFKVFDSSVTAGNHNISILLEYEGGPVGIFSYMKGYQFKVRSSCPFDAQEGKATMIEIQAVRGGGAFKDMKEKADIRCSISTKDLTQDTMDDLESGASDSSEASAAGSGAEQEGGDSQ